MIDNELLCTSKDGKKIYFDTINSHAATHFADTPQLKDLVIEVLKDRDITSSDLQFDVNLGHTIGTCDVVDIAKSDEIVYAIRSKRPEQGYVPFVKNREAQDDSHLSISLVANHDDTYQLLSTWIGTLDSPPFPQQPTATPQSLQYWSEHAFVWGSQKIEPGTATSLCPW